MSDNTTVSADGWEHSVALGSVGFSRGVHYWEFTIDKYTADTDPAFGIARIDVARDKMLGEHFLIEFGYNFKLFFGVYKIIPSKFRKSLELIAKFKKFLSKLSSREYCHRFYSSNLRNFE